MAKVYHYYVEGPSEKKLIEIYNHIVGSPFHPGKVDVFNMVNERLSPARAMKNTKDTYIVLVYDSDVKDTTILDQNIKTLRKYAKIPNSHITHLIAVNNFEDEIVYSTDIKNINSLLNTKSKSEFKSKFINHKDIVACLDKHNFNPSLMWSRKPLPPFDKYKK